MAHFFKNTDGFTLIELALVLAIVGVIAGLSLPLLSQFKDLERKQLTRKNQELILTALGTYAARHQQLPCPSDPQAPHVQQGISRQSCNDVHQGKTFGAVPFRTLGIPEASAKDAFGHPMSYAVNPHLTNKDSFCASTAVPATAQQLTLVVLDERGHPVIDHAEKVPLAVVILSEGDAYKRPISPQEMENMRPSLTFHTRPYAQNPAQPFRHFVTWASRDMLISYYGHSSCIKTPLKPEIKGPQSPNLMGQPDPLFQ